MAILGPNTTETEWLENHQGLPHPTGRPGRAFQVQVDHLPVVNFKLTQARQWQAASAGVTRNLWYYICSSSESRARVPDPGWPAGGPRRALRHASGPIP